MQITIIHTKSTSTSCNKQLKVGKIFYFFLDTLPTKIFCKKLIINYPKTNTNTHLFAHIISSTILRQRQIHTCLYIFYHQLRQKQIHACLHIFYQHKQISDREYRVHSILSAIYQTLSNFGFMCLNSSLLVEAGERYFSASKSSSKIRLSFFLKMRILGSLQSTTLVQQKGAYFGIEL